MTDETKDIITNDEPVAPATETNDGPILYTFSNHQPSRDLEHLLHSFYKGAELNRLGLMQALNIETKQEELLLVGLQFVDGGEAELYPLCTLIKSEDTYKYREPDGEGGWVGYEAEPVAEEKVDARQSD